MADTFRQLEKLESDSFVRDRLERHGMRLQSMASSGRRVRYMIVSIEHNFVLERDLTFRQAAEYAWWLEIGKFGSVSDIE